MTFLGGQKTRERDARDLRNLPVGNNSPYLQAKAQSYGDCAYRCLRDKRCEGFNFYISAHRCNLIENPKEYSDDRRADVGTKGSRDALTAAAHNLPDSRLGASLSI